MTKPVFIASAGSPAVVITQWFDVPRDLVFQTYIDPAFLPHWWGPRRLTTVVDTMIVKAGGEWRFVQRDSAGSQFAFHGVYHTVQPPELIVSTFEYEGTPGHLLLESVRFESQGKKTKLTDQSVFLSTEDRDEMIREGMESGAVESMERLAEVLEKLKTKPLR
jgi:uncharacterized protein YndB with AHSA1/START domain